MKLAMTFFGLSIIFLVALIGGWMAVVSGQIWASTLLMIGSWGFGICIVLAIVFFVIKK